MRKIFLVLSFLSLPAVVFAEGKSFADRDERPQKKSEQENNRKKDSKKVSAKKNHDKDIRNRERGKDIDAPRLRPQPRVVTTAASAQPIIINNNNVNNNNNVVQATTTSVATANAVQVAEPVRVVRAAPRQTVVSETSISTRSGYWDDGAYIGLGLRIGAGDLHQTGVGYDKTFDPVGATFNVSLGYKMSMFRFAGEMGFGAFIADVPPSGAYAKEEDSISAFTMMPQVFFDIDIDPSSRFEPYIGFGAGLGVITAKYDLFWYDDSSSPDKTDSATAANLVYAVMAGVRIALVPALELDFGYRFQDYGNVKLLGYDNKLFANEFTLGLAFKF